MTGKVDAVLGAFWNYEGTDLRLRGKRPRSSAWRTPACPPTTSWCWWRTRTRSRRDADKLRAFIGAVSRGTRDLRKDPDAAIEGLLEANPDLDPELQRAVVKVTLPLFFPPEGRPYGWQDPAQWDAFSAWMRDSNLLEQPPDPAARDNALLPGAGL